MYEKPRLYEVPIKEFYELYNSLICKDEIENLIERYHIKNKHILSVGPGTGHEEYWLYKSGDCKLTFIDIDENKKIEPQIIKLLDSQREKLTNQAGDRNYFKYYIGDFLKYANKEERNAYDILYFSSFTPDELRREKIKSDHVANGSKNNELSSDLQWPAEVHPFHPIVESAIDYLKPLGLLIIQSYCGGVDLKISPNYVNLVSKQLLGAGVLLLDLYYLKEAPGVALYVGFKGSPQEAKAFYEKLTTPLKAFHGRTALSKEAVNLFSMCRKTQ